MSGHRTHRKERTLDAAFWVTCRLISQPHGRSRPFRTNNCTTEARRAANRSKNCLKPATDKSTQQRQICFLELPKCHLVPLTFQPLKPQQSGFPSAAWIFYLVSLHSLRPETAQETITPQSLKSHGFGHSLTLLQVLGK